MKRSRFSEERIIGILKQAEAAAKVDKLVCKHGFSEATFYYWKSRYGGLDLSRLRRLKELEAENSRLKKTFAELSLTHHGLRDAVERKLKGRMRVESLRRCWFRAMEYRCARPGAIGFLRAPTRA